MEGKPTGLWDLARYVGDYQFMQDFTRTVTLSVTLENGVLMMQATGGTKSPIFAESETSFFAQVPDARSPFSPILTASRPG